MTLGRVCHKHVWELKAFSGGIVCILVTGSARAGLQGLVILTDSSTVMMSRNRESMAIATVLMCMLNGRRSDAAIARVRLR